MDNTVYSVLFYHSLIIQKHEKQLKTKYFGLDKFDCMLLQCHVRIFEWIYTLELPRCQGTPCPEQAQYLKGRWGRALILTYLDSPVTEVFPHHWLDLFNFGHLQGEMGGQSWAKNANFGSVSFSWKLESFNCFHATLLFARVLPLVRISAILDRI